MQQPLAGSLVLGWTLLLYLAGLALLARRLGTEFAPRFKAATAVDGAQGAHSAR